MLTPIFAAADAADISGMAAETAWKRIDTALAASDNATRIWRLQPSPVDLKFLSKY